MQAAILLTQLPQEARFTKALIPDAEWSIDTTLLVRIEYELRLLIWAQGDKKKRGPEPQPLEPPSRRMEMESRLDGIDIEETNRILGIGGDTHGH